MKSAVLEELREAVTEWVRNYEIEATLVALKPSGIAVGVHILAVARRVFGNWR